MTSFPPRRALPDWAGTGYLVCARHYRDAAALLLPVPAPVQSLLSCLQVYCQSLLSCLQVYCTNITPEEVLRLEVDVDKQTRLPIITLIGATHKTIWDSRLNDKKIESHHVKAECMSRAYILKKPLNYSTASSIWLEMLNKF